MNKPRRNELNKIIDSLYELQDKIDSLKDDEETAFDNLPESLQYSEKGETMETIIQYLEDALDNIEEAISNIDDAVNE